MAGHRIFSTRFADVYPLYVQKVERKNRSRGEVDQAIRWLTGYSQAELERQLEAGADFTAFFAQAPEVVRKAPLVTGVVCGVRVEAVEDPLMRQIRCLDKLVDEIARGKPMEKIMRDGIKPETGKEPR